MKLLIIATEYPPGPGGIGTHAFELSKHLCQYGWDVTVVASQDYVTSEDVRAFNETLPFHVYSLPRLSNKARQYWERYHLVNQCWSKVQPDFVLASGDPAVYLTSVLAHRYRTPWIAIEHGRNPQTWERWLKRWAFSSATTIVAVSEYSQKRLKQLGVQARHWFVIPNGADHTTFVQLPSTDSSAVRQQIGLGNEPLLLTVGHVSPRKGQEVVIKALPIVLKQIPEVHYAMVGMPTCQKPLRALAHELGVADRVHFLGIVSQEYLVQLLNECDIFVMTSRHIENSDFEGYGIAVIEAALCGKPAIVTSGSGLAEAVIADETALLVKENNPEETAGAILKLLQNKSLRSYMGANARKRALSEQTWVSRVNVYDELMRQLIASNEE